MSEAERKLMNISEYARHRACTPEAVRYAIKKGKLAGSLVFTKEGGVPKIDYLAADSEWIQEVRVAKTDRHVDYGEVERQSATIAESRQRKEAADAELAEIKLSKEKGKLVDAEEVKTAAFKAARVVRDALLNIPDRVAAEIASESDQLKVHALLTQEIRRVLESITIDE